VLKTVAVLNIFTIFFSGYFDEQKFQKNSIYLKQKTFVKCLNCHF